ncbi:MAG: hypothetical protein HY821_24755 [Acidobacteria bacterium]|nr:hypothetical protein [Acidobacteriota bacterium]
MATIVFQDEDHPGVGRLLFGHLLDGSAAVNGFVRHLMIGGGSTVPRAQRSHSDAVAGFRSGKNQLAGRYYIR